MKLNYNGKISKIEKLVGEYNIWELHNCPYGKFKIKIYLSESGHFTGYTNIQVINQVNDYDCAVGYGKSESEALENTILEYLKMVSTKDNWQERDFRYSDPCDF